jgi:hypothetical protein
MILVLRPGNLNNGNYKLNIPDDNQAIMHDLFDGEPITMILNHDLVISVDGNALTFLNHNALQSVELNEWLTEINAVPYKLGNPPNLVFWLVEQARCLIFRGIQ